jgi:hypothetical protein
MTIHRIHLGEAAPEPWRNGGGTTRTLLTWPAADDWVLRVSVADVHAPGPFSPWPGHWRGFAVLEGAGVRLHFGEHRQTLGPDSPPLAFDGAEAPHCEPLAGPTRDLNLMVRHADGPGCIAWALAPGLPAGARWRGLYSHGECWLLRGPEAPLPVAAGTLLWSTDDPHPWQLDRARGAAYWLALPNAGAAR